MDKIRALYEYKNTLAGKEYLYVEEVFILQFLNDGKNALVARKGGYYSPDGLGAGSFSGNTQKAAGITTTLEIMSLSDLVIVDEKTLPYGIVWRELDKALTF